jgi:hypothetical protein
LLQGGSVLNFTYPKISWSLPCVKASIVYLNYTGS